MDLSVIIPCYNEVDNVPKIREELFPVLAQLAQTYSTEVIFVDDGSRDGTGEAFRANFTNALAGVSIRFEQHAVNQGLGAALRTGFAAAQGDLILTTDSDGTYKFDTIPALMACLTDDVDMVTASPYHPGGAVVDVPGYRLFFSKGSSAVYRLLVEWRIHTYTCLFRVYRRAIIDQISFEANGFLAGTELMVKAMLAGFRVAEYPATLYSRVLGTSKAKLIRTIRTHLQFMGQVLAHRLHLISLAEPNAATAPKKMKTATAGNAVKRS